MSDVAFLLSGTCGMTWSDSASCCTFHRTHCPRGPQLEIRTSLHLSIQAVAQLGNGCDRPKSLHTLHCMLGHAFRARLVTYFVAGRTTISHIYSPQLGSSSTISFSKKCTPQRFFQDLRVIGLSTIGGSSNLASGYYG